MVLSAFGWTAGGAGGVCKLLSSTSDADIGGEGGAATGGEGGGGNGASISTGGLAASGSDEEGATGGAGGAGTSSCLSRKGCARLAWSCKAFCDETCPPAEAEAHTTVQVQPLTKNNSSCKLASGQQHQL